MEIIYILLRLNDNFSLEEIKQMQCTEVEARAEAERLSNIPPYQRVIVAEKVYEILRGEEQKIDSLFEHPL